jgi:hypothetical protein
MGVVRQTVSAQSFYSACMQEATMAKRPCPPACANDHRGNQGKAQTRPNHLDEEHNKTGQMLRRCDLVAFNAHVCALVPVAKPVSERAVPGPASKPVETASPSLFHPLPSTMAPKGVCRILSGREGWLLRGWSTRAPLVHSLETEHDNLLL